MQWRFPLGLAQFRSLGTTDNLHLCSGQPGSSVDLVTMLWTE